MKDCLLIHGGVGSDESLSSILFPYAEESFVPSSPLESVMRVVLKMEDNEIFNAGTGSYERIDGSVQMDAAVMTETGFGAVAAVENIKNPILLARDVMEKTPHLIMAGDGAERLARVLGYPEYNPDTEKARKHREKVVNELLEPDGNKEPRYQAIRALGDISELVKPCDTVGAVARIGGKFAAAVSTGGAAPMLRGRVGDSPLPGAGIYCGPKGAVVATGWGEEIISHMLCISIYNDIGTKTLKQSLMDRMSVFKGSVGAIAVSADEMEYYSNKPMAIGSFSR